MTIEENELLKRGNFLGTKAGSLILVHESELVGEFEEEHVAIVLYMAPESEKFSLSIIDYNDQKFKKAQEKGSVFKVSKFGKLRKHYKKMKKYLNERNPNYCSVLMGLGAEVEE